VKASTSSIAVVAGLSLAGSIPSAEAAGRYVAIGDSIAGRDGSYVDLVAARRGITDVQRFISGETAAGALTSVLPSALAAIGDATDTEVVTVQIGGHDFLRGHCAADWNRPSCDFADSLAALLGETARALDADPGSERFVLVTYYNPASGLGDERERSIDRGLLGADGRVDTAAHGDDWGLTDVSSWLACRRGAAVADPWAAFKSGGQALMADTLHPTTGGQTLLADLVERAEPSITGRSCPATTPFAATDPDEGDWHAHGVVEPRLSAARWWFEYGPSNSYGAATPVRDLAPSAGARAVEAALPARPAGTSYHVRLVAENALGRFAGRDHVVVMPAPPELVARVRRRSRRSVLAHGVALRIRTTGTTVKVRGRLRRPGHDPVALRRRLAWDASTARTIRIPLTARGRRLLRRPAQARLAITVGATGPGGVAEPVRLTLRIR
jgi:hypothetical protein